MNYFDLSTYSKRLFPLVAAGLISACGNYSAPAETPIGQLIDQNGGSVKLTTGAGTLVKAEAVSNPDPANTPANVVFDSGFFDFEVGSLTPGQSIQVTLELPAGSTPTSYFKFQNGAFVPFNFNGTEGAQFSGSTVTLTIIDGGLGDDDGIANGVIVDPGAPGFDPDSSPDAFAFDALNSQTTNTVVTSNTVEITGINQATEISIVSGEYSIGCSSSGFTSAVSSVEVNDSVCVRHTTGSGDNITVTSTLTVGDASVGFSSTTAASPATFNVSGTISGVRTASGQWLFSVNGSTVNDGALANGAVTYNAQGVADGASYNVIAQPSSGISCVVSNASGTISGADVTNVDISCQAADTSPDAFAFVDQSGSAKSTLLTSNTVTITGIDAATNISVSGGEYSIGCSTSFTATAATINNNETVCVRHTSASTPETATNTTLFIGDASDIFTSTTAADVATTFTVSGTITGVPDSSSTGQWEIRVNDSFANDGPLSNGAVTYTAQGIADGSSYSVTALPDSGVSCQVSNGSGTISGADVSNVDITCQAADTSPDAFVFTDQTDVAKDTVITSNTVTITGIDTATNISVMAGEYSIGCSAAFTTTAGTINNNDTVCVRHTSASAENTETNTTLFVGDASDTFTSATAQDTVSTFDISGNISVDPSTSTAGSWELRINTGFFNDGALSDGNVTFGTGVADGAVYEVRVFADSGFDCTITNGSGTVSGANITNVLIGCGPEVITPPPADDETVAIKGWKFSNPLPQGEDVNLVVESSSAIIAMNALLLSTGGEALNVMQRGQTGEWFHIGRREVGLDFKAVVGLGSEFIAYHRQGADDFDSGLYSSNNGVDWSLINTTGVDFSNRNASSITSPLIIANGEIIGTGAHFAGETYTRFIYRSADGRAWTETAVGEEQDFAAFGYTASNGDSNIVVSLRSFSTDNGMTWQASTITDNGSPVDPVDANVVWDGSQFVGVFGQDSYTSTTGATWAKHSGAANNSKGFNVDSLSSDGNGTIFAGIRISTELRKSTDGVSFSSVAAPGTNFSISNSLDTGFTASGLLLVVGENGQVFSSTDQGQTLVSETPGLRDSDSSNEVAVYSFATNGTVAVAGGMSAGAILRATDLSGWEEQTKPTYTVSFRNFTATDRYVGAHWTGDRFVLIGAGGTIVTSTDGITWTLQGNGQNSSSRSLTPADFAQSGQTVLVLNPNGRTLLRSTNNGASFTSSSLSSLGVDNGHLGLIHDGSNFILIGEEMASSVDGVTWTVNDLVFDQSAEDVGVSQLESIAFSDGVYAANYFGVSVFSSDAINWTLVDSDDFALVANGRIACLNEVIDAVFYMACDDGVLYRSTNGSDWELEMGRREILIDADNEEVSADNALDVVKLDLKGVSQFQGNLIVHGIGGAIMHKPFLVD